MSARTELDEIIPAAWSRTKIHNDKKNDPLTDLGVVRFYTHSPGIACLQIRTEGHTSDYGTTNHQAFSSAGLGLSEAVRLKNALELWIGDWSKEAATPPAAVTDQSLLTELLQSRFPSPKFKVKAGSCNTFLLNDEGQTIVFSFDGSGRLVLVWAKEGRERGSDDQTPGDEVCS